MHARSGFRNGHFFRHVRADGIYRLTLGNIPDVRIVFEHYTVEMAGNAHDGLITGFTFGKPNDCAVSQVVEAQARECCHCALSFSLGRFRHGADGRRGIVGGRGSAPCDGNFRRGPPIARSKGGNGSFRGADAKQRLYALFDSPGFRNQKGDLLLTARRPAKRKTKFPLKSLPGLKKNCILVPERLSQQITTDSAWMIA
jgi:hypothetical protein